MHLDGYLVSEWVNGIFRRVPVIVLAGFFFKRFFFLYVIDVLEFDVFHQKKNASFRLLFQDPEILECALDFG